MPIYNGVPPVLPFGLVVFSRRYDADASNLIDAAGVTTEAHRTGINDFTVGYKADGLWDDSDVIYLFPGSTAASQKFNLKNTADSNAAFRASFLGTGTHSATGYLPNGTTGYINTFWTNYAATSHGLSCYLRNHTSGRLSGLGGSYQGINQMNQLYADTDNTIKYDAYNSAAGRIVSNATAVITGLISGNRTSNNSAFIYKNGAAISSELATIGGIVSSIAVYLGAINNAGTPFAFSNQEMGFARIGRGFNSTKEAASNARVQALMTVFGRNV